MSESVNEEDRILLEQLKPKGVDGIVPVAECLEGTREYILLEKLLWIRGHPGVGESALASTIASRLEDRRRLVSYFVFQRAEADMTTTSALWRHVAYGIASRIPSARQRIIRQLEAGEIRLNTPNS